MPPAGREDLLEVEGVIEHIVYKNDTNGYTVCELAAANDELITLGRHHAVSCRGGKYKALGKWELHMSFGRQFKIEYYEKQLPASEASMFKYLSSGAIKGIGPVTAKLNMERFGTDAFEVIEHNPEWLADVEGITLKKARKISERFKETFGVRSVMMFCRDFFGPATAIKVYKQWGGAAVDVIKANPYALCEAIDGIGFETADHIAEKLGTDKTSPIESKPAFSILSPIMPFKTDIPSFRRTSFFLPQQDFFLPARKKRRRESVLFSAKESLYR